MNMVTPTADLPEGGALLTRDEVRIAALCFAMASVGILAMSKGAGEKDAIRKYTVIGKALYDGSAVVAFTGEAKGIAVDDLIAFIKYFTETVNAAMTPEQKAQAQKMLAGVLEKARAVSGA